MLLRSPVLTVYLLVAGCGGAAGSASPEPTAGPGISVLFMGNSHTSFHGLPEMVVAMVRAARPGQAVTHVEAPGWMFLEERVLDAASVELLRGRDWDFVVLQAQKYSSSGKYTYSTAGAESLVRMAREAKAVPILFPEWPRRGVAETQRIHDLHVSIARRTPACVAPIGQAFDRARAAYPDVALHAEDGNHAAPAGAFLAALMLASTITEASPETFPTLPQFAVAADVQLRLRGIAAETVAASPPRRWCPSDL